MCTQILQKLMVFAICLQLCGSREVSAGQLGVQCNYHGTTLEFTELLRVTHSFTNVCRKQSACQLSLLDVDYLDG